MSYEIFNFKCTCILFQVAEQFTQNGNIETVVQIRTTCDNFHTSGMLCILVYQIQKSCINFFRSIAEVKDQSIHMHKISNNSFYWHKIQRSWIKYWYKYVQNNPFSFFCVCHIQKTTELWQHSTIRKTSIRELHYFILLFCSNSMLSQILIFTFL